VHELRNRRDSNKIKGKGLRGKAAVFKHDHVMRDRFDVFHQMWLTDGRKEEPMNRETKLFVVMCLGKVLRMRRFTRHPSGCRREFSYDETEP